MYKKGTVVLTPFPFTDLSSSKVRPALIVSNNLTGSDVVLVFISSNTKKQAKNDVLISEKDAVFAKSGLKSSSIIKVSKIATLEKKVILGELGVLDKLNMKKVDTGLKKVFGL